MGQYAAQRTVTPEKSRTEIERTLTRFGATSFIYGWDQKDGQTIAVVVFRLADRHIRLNLPLPRRDDPEFTEYLQGAWRRPSPPSLPPAALPPPREEEPHD